MKKNIAKFFVCAGLLAPCFASAGTASVGSIDFSTIVDSGALNFDSIYVNDQGWWDSKTLYVSQSFVVPEAAISLDSLTIGNQYDSHLSMTINGSTFTNGAYTYMNNDWYTSQTFDTRSLKVVPGEVLTFELHGTGQPWILGKYEAGQAYSYLVPWDQSLSTTVAPIHTLAFEAQFTTSSLSPVPEPATWATMLAGLILVCGLIRNKHRAAP